MALAPCHCLFQTQVAAGRLNLQLYQRSADIFLGVPFNIASYALLTHMLARECGLEPGVFVWTGGDCHLYSNHLEQARLQLTREPRPLPRLVIKDRGQGLFDYEPEDFVFENYDPHPHISAPSRSDRDPAGAIAQPNGAVSAAAALRSCRQTRRGQAMFQKVTTVRPDRHRARARRLQHRPRRRSRREFGRQLHREHDERQQLLLSVARQTAASVIHCRSGPLTEER